MLIDCDTCTVRGHGCSDCVVTVLLGAPPGRHADPVVLPLLPRGTELAAPAELPGANAAQPPTGVVVDFDEVERRAVRALAEVGLVPPLRHREAAGHDRDGGEAENRAIG